MTARSVATHNAAMSTADRGGATARRIFTGLFPSPDVQTALDHYRRSWSWPAGSSQPRPQRLHLTLQFFGALDDAGVSRLQQSLAGIAFEPFTLVLGTPEVWRHNGVAVLRPHPNRALSALHENLATALRAAGMPQPEPDWQPHVTLGRRAGSARPPDSPLALAWTVDQFVLVESLRAPLWRYDVLARYGASAAQPP
jgi:2'-5' RNA ligase